MNFALDLGAGAVAGVATDSRALVRAADGDPDDPRSATLALNREVFGGTLTPAAIAAGSSVATSSGVPVANRVVGVLFGGPDMQVR